MVYCKILFVVIYYTTRTTGTELLSLAKEFRKHVLYIHGRMWIKEPEPKPKRTVWLRSKDGFVTRRSDKIFNRSSPRLDSR